MIDLPPNVPDGARVIDAQRNAQRDLATIQLPGSVHAIADRSDHNIHVRQPELVVDAARDVVARATLPAAPSANVSWGWLALTAVLGALVALAVGALVLRTRRARARPRPATGRIRRALDHILTGGTGVGDSRRRAPHPSPLSNTLIVILRSTPSDRNRQAVRRVTAPRVEPVAPTRFAAHGSGPEAATTLPLRQCFRIPADQTHDALLDALAYRPVGARRCRRKTPH